VGPGSSQGNLCRRGRNSRWVDAVERGRQARQQESNQTHSGALVEQRTVPPVLASICVQGEENWAESGRDSGGDHQGREKMTEGTSYTKPKGLIAKEGIGHSLTRGRAGWPRRKKMQHFCINRGGPCRDEEGCDRTR